MLFYMVWGTKVVPKRLGRVADFCFICRDFRPFRATVLEKVSHLYYISIGSRTAVDYQRTCETCNCTFKMNPVLYPSLSRNRQATLNDLIAETHPRIWENWYDRLQSERRARDGQLTPEERRSFLLEPFLLLDYRVGEWKANPRWDGPTMFGLLATFASLFCALSGLGQRPSSAVGMPKEVSFGLFLVCLFFYLWASATRTRRFVVRGVLPVITRSLRQVAPSAAELNAVFQHLRAIRSPIGRSIRIKDLQVAFGVEPSSLFAP